MDIVRVISDSQKESSFMAETMRVQSGDEINIGSYSYIVTEISDTHVFGIMISKHGHFVNDHNTYHLDLRKKRNWDDRVDSI